MPNLDLQAVDLSCATDLEYRVLVDIRNRLWTESDPDDPPKSFGWWKRSWASLPGHLERHYWFVWHEGRQELKAFGSLFFAHLDTNQHLCWCDLGVLPEFRRAGIGKALLEVMLSVARENKRSVSMGFTQETVPAGEAFAQHLRAEAASGGHENRLELAGLDRGLLERWLQVAPQDAFELGFWEGAYPEEHLPAMCELWEMSANTEPRDGLNLEDQHFTPERLRAFEQSMKIQGTQRWTVYVRERETGSFAGISEMTWDPEQPNLIFQEGTGVQPEFRGRGLGRWLKAAMLERLLREKPEVKHVRTGNADSNEAMLKINTALGFKPHSAHVQWQVETEKVLELLRSKVV